RRRPASEPWRVEVSRRRLGVDQIAPWETLKQLGLWFLNLSRNRLPLSGFDACGVINVRFLRPPDDKYATRLGNVSLATFSIRFRARQLQKKLHHFKVWSSAGLVFDRTAVVIPRVGVRAFATEVHEKRVHLEGNTHRLLPHEKEKLVVGRVD